MRGAAVPAVEHMPALHQRDEAVKMLLVDDAGVGGVGKRVLGIKLLDIPLGLAAELVFDGAVYEHVIRRHAGLPGV